MVSRTPEEWRATCIQVGEAPVGGARPGDVDANIEGAPPANDDTEDESRTDDGRQSGMATG